MTDMSEKVQSVVNQGPCIICTKMLLLLFSMQNILKVTGLQGYGDKKCHIHPRILP